MTVNQINKRPRNNILGAYEGIHTGTNVQSQCSALLFYYQNAQEGHKTLFELLGETTGSKVEFLKQIGIDSINISYEYRGNQYHIRSAQELVDEIDRCIHSFI